MVISKLTTSQVAILFQLYYDDNELNQMNVEDEDDTNLSKRHAAVTFESVHVTSLRIYPFWIGEGGAGSPSNTKSPGPRPTSIPSDILIHAVIWLQQIWAENWGLWPFRGGELGPHLIQCGQGRGLPACQVPSWSVQLFGHSARTSQTDRQTRQTDNGPIA